MKIGLYSVSYSGLWYNGPVLPIETVLSRASELGYDGIEVDGKEPHGFTLRWNSKKREQVRGLAERAGVEIFAIAADNNFTSSIPEEREAQMIAVCELIKLAKDLGARIVRVFAAWPGVTIVDGKGAYDIARAEQYRFPATYRQKWVWSRDCLQTVAEVAEKYEVILALQNHKPVLRNYGDMIDMVTEIDSDYVKCSLDCPLLNSQDDAYVAETVRATGYLQVLSHFGGEFTRQPDGKLAQRVSPSIPWFNYPAFIKTLQEIDYDGFLSYELCHQFLPVRHEFGTLEQVDEQVAYALEYMRELIRC